MRDALDLRQMGASGCLRFSHRKNIYDYLQKQGVFASRQGGQAFLSSGELGPTQYPCKQQNSLRINNARTLPH